jgi:cell wall-associated NlpC family hydrolase
MSIAMYGSWWLAAWLAGAPAEGGTRLEEYGGSYRCKDEAVKAQVVRALSSGSVPYSANAIKAASKGLQLDAKPVAVGIGKATSVVTKPGAAGSPSSLRIKRTGPGAALDVLMCRYRRPANKAWASIGTSDLLPDGHLAKRMPADVKMLGRAFALKEKAGESEDSVLVLVASGVDGKSAEVNVSGLAKGLQKRKGRGAASGGKGAAKRILAEAADPSWEKYEYGEEVVFPEAKDEVFGYENKAFDCSYYVWLVYHRAGIDYDFTGTEGLASLDSGQFVEVKTPKPGDLVVWRPEIGSGNIHHVGIVAEDTATFWDNSGSNSVGISKFSWPVYDVPRLYLRRTGL